MHKKLKAEQGTEAYDAETIEKMINRKFKLTFHNTSDFTFRNSSATRTSSPANLGKLHGRVLLPCAQDH